MKKLMATVVVFVAVASSAYAGGPTQGTYAGQDTRGSQVSNNAHKYNDAGSNYGQSQIAREVDEDSPHGGGRDDNVQGNIGLSTTVGNDSNK